MLQKKILENLLKKTNIENLYNEENCNKFLFFLIKKNVFPAGCLNFLKEIKNNLNEHGYDYFHYYLDDVNANLFDKLNFISESKKHFLEKSSHNFYNKKFLIYTNIISLAKELENKPNTIITNPMRNLLSKNYSKYLPDICNERFENFSSKESQIFEMQNLILMLYSKKNYFLYEDSLQDIINNLKKNFESRTNKHLSNYF